MKKSLLCLFVFVAAYAAATAADYFFYRGSETDVPKVLRFVRVIDHQGQPAIGAKIVVSFVGKRTLEGTTDATGTVQFPGLEVARVESVRCEVPSFHGAYVTSIAADAHAIAWPVVFHLLPRRE